MLEQICRVWRHALPEQQTGGHETVERRCQLRFRLTHHRSQQRMRKLSPDRCADLRHLLGGAEPVEPRHQRRVQACWNRESGGRSRCNRALGRALAVRFQHRLRHLLYEQRNAVGALDDVLPDARRDELVANQPIDHGADFALW
jgi:hypothetical protein